MASPALFRNSTRKDLYICARCSLRAIKSPNQPARRWIGMKYLAKIAEAEKDWRMEANEIKAGRQKSMLTILEERGLVNTIAGNRDEVDRRMTETRVGAYVGIDPTASSLHVGHLLPFMALAWMYTHGYHAVTVLGGATAKIGDPTDRLTTRDRMHSSERTTNMVSMHYQLKKLWANIEAYGKRHGFYEKKPWALHRELVNNHHWWNKLPLLEVLQTLGPGMRLGSMLARDTVKNKLSKGDGMSFAEFTYPLMQAWDWWHMYHTKGIHMQIGGSDQFGNITAGIDAIKYISRTHPMPEVADKIYGMGDPFGLTVPLLTTGGKKFGKSEGNAVWLDSDQTSPFELYGFLLRTPDAEVQRYLKMFTFLPLEQIDGLVEDHLLNPPARKAQHMLARELVELVHGPIEAKDAEAQHRLLFQKKPAEETTRNVAAEDRIKVQYITLNNRPKINVQLPASVLERLSIARIVYAAGLATSATEAHHLVQNDGIRIGGVAGNKDNVAEPGAITWVKVSAWANEETAKWLIGDDLLMLRRGKHNIRVIQVVPDQEYTASGRTYPGQKIRSGPLSNLELRNKKVLDNLQSAKGQEQLDND